ncbi:MAG: acyl-CoA dehydrogenase family protein [Bifidobacteriaceae bacterium]|jgi:alkylation response protein AidB-like acyl-CoA dehydrogenase|nr:acyl-CoA dehydrogenase family protein [Bifidobacteriaceae bacterium]
MSIRLGDAHESIRASVREFAQTEIKPLAPVLDREYRPATEAIPKLAEMGILGIGIPEEYGGSGSDRLGSAIMLEELARCCATTSAMVQVHGSMCAESIATWGTEGQKRRHLPDMAAGRSIGAFCLTEPGSGSDAGSLKSKAVKDCGSYVLTGEKMFITSGSIAGVFLVMARTSDDLGTRGISAFLVERDTQGLTVGEPMRKMGLRGSPTNRLLFQEARVPASALLGGVEGTGFKVAMSGLDRGRIGIAAQALGIAQGAYDEGVTYARSRVQFGAPIADLQAIQWMVADMRTDIEAGRLLAYHAAGLADRHLPYGQEAAIAKLFNAQMAVRVCDLALQIHGGYGYVEGFPIERMYRDARITEIYEGTNEIQRLIIARKELR